MQDMTKMLSAVYTVRYLKQVTDLPVSYICYFDFKRWSDVGA